MTGDLPNIYIHINIIYIYIYIYIHIYIHIYIYIYIYPGILWQGKYEVVTNTQLQLSEPIQSLAFDYHSGYKRQKAGRLDCYGSHVSSPGNHREPEQEATASGACTTAWFNSAQSWCACTDSTEIRIFGEYLSLKSSLSVHSTCGS